MPKSFIIEGIDRLGKSTLVKGILNELGYHLVIHYSKPEVLKTYDKYGNALQVYQKMVNRSMFDLIDSGVPIIFDRGHLGETIYAPLYRGYCGDYVYDLENEIDTQDTALILLTTNDVDLCIDDGLSHNFDKRGEEQMKFIKAFQKSSIKNKHLIDVCEPDDVKFRDSDDILKEILKKVCTSN